MSKPLTFGELLVGDKFIAFPEDGDDSGHGGYRGEYHIFKKTAKNVSGEYFKNGRAVLLCNDIDSTIPHSMKVIKVR